MRSLRTSLRLIAQAEDGATLLEFGFVAPVLCLLLVGSLEIGHTLYMQGVLEGALQKAARDGTLETAAGNTAAVRDAIDDAVEGQVLKLHHSADVQFSRRFYRTFTDAAEARAEEFTDTNEDGECNDGEPFEDLNGNETLDLDGGDDVTRAGARDNVVYSVKVEYPRMFPLYRFIGGSDTTTLHATTVLANQPFGDQQSYDEPTVGHCT